MVKKKKVRKSLVLKKLDKLEDEIHDIEKYERRNIREEKKIKKEQEKINKVLINLGKFTFKRKHLLELV